MKRTRILQIIIFFVLASLSACQDDLPVVGPDEEASASLFMTKSVSELDENLLLIQAAMQHVDSITPFLTDSLGCMELPCGNMHCLWEEERDISYLVPVYKEEIPNIIHTIWFFDIQGDTLRYRTITREMNRFVLTNRILSSTS